VQQFVIIYFKCATSACCARQGNDWCDGQLCRRHEWWYRPAETTGVLRYSCRADATTHISVNGSHGTGQSTDKNKFMPVADSGSFHFVEAARAWFLHHQLYHCVADHWSTINNTTPQNKPSSMLKSVDTFRNLYSCFA